MSGHISPHHLFMRVSDLRRSRAFYVEALGLRVLLEQDGYIRVGGPSGFHIGIEEGTDTAASRTIEIQLQVDDVDRCYRQLLSSGVRFSAPPADMPWGARHAFLDDPDGQPLSIFTPLSGEPSSAGASGERLHHIRATELSADTAQTGGMRRVAAVSSGTVGSAAIWMGETSVAPATVSAPHHHGHSETGIFVVRGNPVFVHLDGDREVRLETQPGDYVFVPPFVPHREENPSPDQEAVVIIARSTQEAIVVNLDSLSPRRPPREA